MTERLKANLKGEPDPGPPPPLKERLAKKKVVPKAQPDKAPAEGEVKTEDEPSKIKPIKTVSGLKTDPDPDPGDGGGDSDSEGEDQAALEVDDSEVPAAIKSPQAAENWKKLKRTLKESNAKLARVEAQIQEKDALLQKVQSSQPTFTPKEYEDVKAERDQLRKEMDTVALERSPAFRSKYQAIIEGAVNRAKNVVGEENATKAEGLIKLPPSKWRNAQLNEIREGLETGVDRGQLDMAVAEADRVRDEMNQAISNSQETMKAMQAEEKFKQDKATEELESHSKRRLEKAIELTSQGTAFTEIEGDEEHNKAAAERIARVKQFFSGELPEDQLVQYPVLAEENLFLTGTYIPALLQELNTVTEENRTIKGLSPAPGSKTGKKAEGSGGTQGDKPGFIQRFRSEYTPV